MTTNKSASSENLLEPKSKLPKLVKELLALLENANAWLYADYTARYQQKRKYHRRLSAKTKVKKGYTDIGKGVAEKK